MPETTAPLLSESEVEELEARAKKYRDLAKRAATPADEDVIRWLTKTVAALTRDWRALKAENDLAEKVLKFILPNHPLASITEIAKPALAEVDALREQLAQAEKARHEASTTTDDLLNRNRELADQLDKLRTRILELETDIDTKAGYL